MTRSKRSGKSGKSGKRQKQKKQKSKSIVKRNMLVPSAKPAKLTKPDSILDAERITREFAKWAAGESNCILVEVKKSVVAEQLGDLGVHRGMSILTRAVKALEQEAIDRCNAQTLAEIEQAAAAEDARCNTPAIQAEADRILRAPDILAEMVKATDTLGHVGEEAVRSLVLLSAVAGLTARTHEDAIHLILKGVSAGGKNAVIKRVLHLLPLNASLVLSNATQLGLVYLGQSFPVLVFQEVEGVKGAEYIVRQLMSEGTITRITAKERISTEFKTSVITTTTREHTHPENETRAFSIAVNSNSELTHRIIMAEAAIAAGRPRATLDDTLLMGWRAALRRLKPAEVNIPFAEDMVADFSHEQVRARRDIKRMLNLVRANARLHQYSRQRDAQGRIVAEIRDHEMVEPILAAVFQDNERLTTTQGTQLLALLGQLAAADTDGGWVPVRILLREAARTKCASARTVRAWCHKFVELRRCEERGLGGRLEYRQLGNIANKAIA